MTDISELAARCEAATGPDRELDCRIWTAVGPVDFSFELGRAVVPDFGQWQAPYYTVSLDASLTLVPEGIEGLPLSFKVERFYLGNGIVKCRASVWCGLGSVSSLDTASDAATPALALCAAALRARSKTQAEGR